MCLAVPALIIAIPAPDTALVELDGVRLRVSLALLDEVAVGDYVIVHVGFALQKLDIEEAEATLAALRALDASTGEPAP